MGVVGAQKHYAAPCSKIKACLDLLRLVQNDHESIMSCKNSPGITPIAAASAPTPFCFVPWVRTKAFAARKQSKNQTTLLHIPYNIFALSGLGPSPLSQRSNKHICKGQIYGSRIKGSQIPATNRTSLSWQWQVYCDWVPVVLGTSMNSCTCCKCFQ